MPGFLEGARLQRRAPPHDAATWRAAVRSHQEQPEARYVCA